MHAFYVRAGEHSLFTCCYVREKETDRKRVVQQVDDAESVTLEPPSRRGCVHLLHRRRRRRRRHVLAARNVDASRPVRLRRRHLPASSSFVTRRDAGRRPLSRYRGALESPIRARFEHRFPRACATAMYAQNARVSMERTRRIDRDQSKRIHDNVAILFFHLLLQFCAEGEKKNSINL